jgi:Zn ribbon nucleic-acid-binding protein
MGHAWLEVKKKFLAGSITPECKSLKTKREILAPWAVDSMDRVVYVGASFRCKRRESQKMVRSGRYQAGAASFFIWVCGWSL